MNCEIEMATTHRLSLLFIILISGFKLGMAAPADGTRGKMCNVIRVEQRDSEKNMLIKSTDL